jgi:hypothetical protein
VPVHGTCPDSELLGEAPHAERRGSFPVDETQCCIDDDLTTERYALARLARRLEPGCLRDFRDIVALKCIGLVIGPGSHLT